MKAKDTVKKLSCDFLQSGQDQSSVLLRIAEAELRLGRFVFGSGLGSDSKNKEGSHTVATTATSMYTCAAIAAMRSSS